jgi:hypothetical protein
MDNCEQMWLHGRKLEGLTGSDRDRCSQILSRASPTLIQILQTIEFLHYNGSSLLFQIHLLLDFSWDELKTVICSLRLLIGDEGEGLLTKLFHVLLDSTLFPVPFDLIMLDLACGSLRLMQRILKGELIKNIV